MITLSKAIKHYKKKEIQEEMLLSAKKREIAAKFSEKGFGKRPDTINYPGDIFELVKQGATSFHVSEEIWKSPLQLSTELKKSDLDSLRSGWDLIIDIDFEIWEITKLICSEIIKAIKAHGINSVTCKFSGNKGFHIGVPFDAFPEKLHNTDTRLLFPEATRRVLAYLADYIDNKENNFRISKIITKDKEFNNLLKNAKDKKAFLKEICEECSNEIKPAESHATEFVCPSCSRNIISQNSEKYMVCQGCGKYMEKISSPGNEKKCPRCSSRKTIKKANLFIDAMLISSRHLYRMPYSLHEKSGLASIPVGVSSVLSFEKKSADPENLEIPKIRFLDSRKTIRGEASKLIIQAFDYKIPDQEEQQEQREYEPLDFALQEQHFPPCIKKGLNGLSDGRKRFSFILINFLRSAGWEKDKIKEALIAWNKKNNEPLRESSLLSQLSYSQKRRKSILPPNCSNSAYYKDIGICGPDGLCSRIKNPLNYSIRKSGASNRKKHP